MQHRHRLEEETTRRSEDRMDWSQRFALAVAIFGLAASAVVGIYGSAWASTVIAIASVGGPGAAMILSRMIGRPQKLDE